MITNASNSKKNDEDKMIFEKQDIENFLTFARNVVNGSNIQSNEDSVSLDGRDIVIVTRRQWIVDWLSRRGIQGKVMESVTADDIRGKYVIGALPAHLAQYADCMFSVDYNVPFEKRVKTITADDLDECGAKLFAYQVVPKILVHKVNSDGSN